MCGDEVGTVSWLSASLKKIGELRELRAGWDSYNAQPIQERAIQEGSDLLMYLARLDLPEPRIVPTSAGGIQLEFQKDERELELEILPDGSIEFLTVEMQEGTVLAITSSRMFELANWLCTGLDGRHYR